MRQVLLGLGLSLICGAASAQGVLDPTRTTQCLDVGGQTLPVVCQVHASRLDLREDYCLCPEGRRVEVSVCGVGEREPTDTVAYDRARRLASRDGSLIGDKFQGGAMCVAPRRTF